MVLGEVKRTFNPEFINRIDEIIVFEALSDEDLRRIMGLLLDQLNANLADRRMKVALATEVVDWIIDVTCKDRSYGARPLRRAIQRYVEDPLAEQVLRGKFRGPSRCVVKRNGDELTFEDATAKPPRKRKEEEEAVGPRK
jgi:ATP-dependent Clp protease ATP-binding subunit ClpC